MRWLNVIKKVDPWISILTTFEGPCITQVWHHASRRCNTMHHADLRFSRNPRETRTTPRFRGRV